MYRPFALHSWPSTTNGAKPLDVVPAELDGENMPKE